MCQVCGGQVEELHYKSLTDYYNRETGLLHLRGAERFGSDWLVMNTHLVGAVSGLIGFDYSDLPNKYALARIAYRLLDLQALGKL